MNANNGQKLVVTEQQIRETFLAEAKRRGVNVIVKRHFWLPALPDTVRQRVAWVGMTLASAGLVLALTLPAPVANNMGANNPAHQRVQPVTVERVDHMGANNPRHQQVQQVAIVLPAPTAAQINPIPQPVNVVVPPTRMALSVAQQVGPGGSNADNVVVYQEPQQQSGYQPQWQPWQGRQRPQYQVRQNWFDSNEVHADVNVYSPRLTYSQIQPAGVQPQYQHYAPVNVMGFRVQPPPRLQAVTGGVYRVSSPLSCPGALGLLGGIFGACSGGGFVQLQPNGQYLPVR